MASASPIVPNPSQAVAAARAALTEALVLKVGDVLQAVVVGKMADDLTALKIGEQTVVAKLPQLNLAVGSTLQLQVKAAGTMPQLQVVGTTAPAVGRGTSPVALPAAPSGYETVEPSAGARPAVPPPAQPKADMPDLKAKITQVVGSVSSKVDSGAIHLPAPPRPVTQAARETAPRATTPSPEAAKAAELPTHASGPPPQQSVPSARGITPESATLPQGGAMAPSEPKTAKPLLVVEPLVENSDPDPVASTPRPPIAAAIRSSDTGQVSPQPAALTLDSAARLATAQFATPGIVLPDVAEPQIANSLLVAQSAPRPPASLVDLPRNAPPGLAALTTELKHDTAQPAAPPATPRAALAQMLPDALSKQDSTGPLLLSLAAAVQRPGLFPEPILRAAVNVLAQRIIVSDGKVEAGQIEQAITRSGVALEASLLKGEPQPRDAKAGLLVLREALAKWLGEAPRPAPAGHGTPPPPIKGLPLRAMTPEASPPLPDLAGDIGRLLHTETDAAVSRLKLMQLASLPDADSAKPAAPTLRMELPFLIGHELVMAQLQVGRDGARRETERKRGWTMRFALNFSATGEVGAEVGVLGKAVNVSLWAAEPETAEAMGETLPELARALEAVGLKPGAMRIRHGAPTVVQRHSGHLLDSIS